MQRFIDAVRKSLASENWHAALFMAIALPDMCGWAENKPGSKARTVQWFDTYLGAQYRKEQRQVGPPGLGLVMPEVVFMTGGDFYALRCALLHEGNDTIKDQSARDALTRFRFTSPTPFDNLSHRNLIWRDQQGMPPGADDAVLQLDVKTFCEDVCQGLETWLSTVAGDAAVQARLAETMEINPIGSGLGDMLIS